MRYNFCSLLLLSLFFGSCQNREHTAGNTNEQKTDSSIALHGNWYKHFTGTIAGQPVCVNLYHYKKDLRGTYYYSNKLIPIELINGEDSTADNNELYLTEDACTERSDDNDYTNNAHWVVILNGDKITGKWVSKDKRTSYDISLRESYPNGTYKFDVVLADSSVGKGIATAESSWQISIPAEDMEKDDRDFLDAVMKKDMGLDSEAGRNYTAFISTNNGHYLQNFLNDLDSTDTDSDDSLANHGESADNISVIYNEHGLVVFESLSNLYMGGAHGIYGSVYTCADVWGKRTWGLKDVIKVDTPALVAAIGQEARQVFKIKDEEKLSSKLFVDTIPLTNNTYITESGIAFSYTPYEIASFADGQVTFFIPFSRVMNMLTPDFKKRMKQ